MHNFSEKTSCELISKLAVWVVLLAHQLKLRKVILVQGL